MLIEGYKFKLYFYSLFFLQQQIYPLCKANEGLRMSTNALCAMDHFGPFLRFIYAKLLYFKQATQY